MAAVIRVLPRQWDGHRLLRFLAGLAMLALAFIAHVEAPPVPTVISAPAAAVPAEAPAPVAAAEPAPVERVVEAIPALPAPTTVAVITAVLMLIAGAALRVPTGRAPPFA